MRVEQGQIYLTILYYIFLCPSLYPFDSTITLFRPTPLTPLGADSLSSNRKEYVLPLSVTRRKLWLPCNVNGKSARSRYI